MQQAPSPGIVGRIGSFFITAVKSCYDMEWYRTVRARPWTSGLRYAAWLQAALTLFTTAALASQLFGGETAFIVHLQTTFPDDAALEVKSGHLSTNLPQPFEAGSKWIRVVIDTSVEGTTAPEKYKGMDGVLVGKDAIFMPQPHYQTPPSVLTQQRIYRMEDFSEFAVTKRELLSWLQTWGGLFILGSLVMFALAYWAAMLIMTAVYVGITSGAAFAIGKLAGIRTGYRAWVAVGFHAVTLPLFVNFAMASTNVRIPLAFSFVFFMFVVAVIADERSQPVAPQDEGPTPPPNTPTPPRVRKVAVRKPRARRPEGAPPQGPDEGNQA
ncbi:MAG: hypothetical protein RL272_379 [Candidatus Parcubacteria bacterium]|jgi:hypothetical protein